MKLKTENKKINTPRVVFLNFSFSHHYLQSNFTTNKFPQDNTVKDLKLQKCCVISLSNQSSTLLLIYKKKRDKK